LVADRRRAKGGRFDSLNDLLIIMIGLLDLAAGR
jgi:hypothetical protein